MITERLTALLNRGLVESSRAQALAAQLAGKSLAVQLDGSPMGVVVSSNGSLLSLQIASTDALPTADATVRGGALSLLRLAGPEQRTVIQSGAVRISGSGEIAERFSELAALVRPDIESELAGFTGAVPAHLLMSGARGAWRQARQTAQSLLRTGADYLAHERGTLVPRGEADHFLRNVEALRERLDRLDATVTLLDRRQQRLVGRGTEPQP